MNGDEDLKQTIKMKGETYKYEQEEWASAGFRLSEAPPHYEAARGPLPGGNWALTEHHSTPRALHRYNNFTAIHSNAKMEKRSWLMVWDLLYLFKKLKNKSMHENIEK